MYISENSTTGDRYILSLYWAVATATSTGWVFRSTLILLRNHDLITSLIFTIHASKAWLREALAWWFPSAWSVIHRSSASRDLCLKYRRYVRPKKDFASRRTPRHLKPAHHLFFGNFKFFRQDYIFFQLSNVDMTLVPAMRQQLCNDCTNTIINILERRSGQK